MDVQEVNASQNITTEILASPAYQERCDILFDLFCLSRAADRDPKKLLAIQAGLVELHNHFQQKNAEFKKEGNELGKAVIRRLLLILRQIADAMAWRVLDYDRVLIQLLAEHLKTGWLDDTVFGDLVEAQQIVENEGAIVLINDLTNILRHGDLTVIQGKTRSFREMKYGKATKHNTRATRQRKTLNELVTFLNTGFRSTENRRDFILKADIPIKTYHSAVSDTIKQAKQKGYQRKYLSESLAIEALWFKNETASLPKIRPFGNLEHISCRNNLEIFDKPISRIAPYGIFPLEDRLCFDLISGEVLLGSTLNFYKLQKQYAEFGLTLELTNPNPQEIEKSLSASIVERTTMMDMGKFSIRDGKFSIIVTPDMFGRIILEFLHEDAVIQVDRQLMNFIKASNISDDKTTRFYVGYLNENVWL